MCTPPLGPIGASPDDSQAASGPSTCDRRCGYPAPVSGLRAIRARALCVLSLAIAGVAALAAGAAGATQAPPTSASAYGVLINVPGAQSSGTLSSPAGSYQYRDLVAIHSYAAGSALG